MRGSTDSDERFPAEMLIERFILGLLEVHKTKGENQKFSFGKVLGEISEVVGICGAVELEMSDLKLVFLFQILSKLTEGCSRPVFGLAGEDEHFGVRFVGG